MWVADMEFAAPVCISKALETRARQASYGYTEINNLAIETFRGWLNRRHGAAFGPSQLAITDALLPSMQAALLETSGAGDGVIVMPPLYPPLLAMPKALGREPLHCELALDENGYGVDWDCLETLAPHASCLLWCSPHNPVGRVWRSDEIDRLLVICRQHDVTILSDEAHADLVTREGARHVVLADRAGDDDRVVSVLTPGKTFNTQGLGMAALACPDPSLLARIQATTQARCPLPHNPFSIAALEAGYRDGDDWLDALNRYLSDSRGLVETRLENTPITPIPAEGTYLVWLDARALGLQEQALAEFFLDRAGLGLNPGSEFGKGGEGFMRMNIALPREQLDQALDQLIHACNEQKAL